MYVRYAKYAKLRVAALLLALSTLASLATGCGGARATDLNIVHYSLPGCSHCSQMTAALRQLEDEFPGKVRTDIVDATEPKTAVLVRNMEFGDHGVVVRGRRGEVLYKVGSRQGGIEEVRSAIRQLIDQRQASL